MRESIRLNVTHGEYRQPWKKNICAGWIWTPLLVWQWNCPHQSRVRALCQNLQAQKERIVASSIWNGIPMWKTVPTTPGVLYWYEPSTQLLTTSKYTDLASSSITVCIASSLCKKFVYYMSPRFDPQSIILFSTLILVANHEELQSLLDFFIAINPDNQQPGDCGTSRRTHQQHDYMCGSYWCNF